MFFTNTLKNFLFSVLLIGLLFSNETSSSVNCSLFNNNSSTNSSNSSTSTSTTTLKPNQTTSVNDSSTIFDLSTEASYSNNYYHHHQQQLPQSSYPYIGLKPLAQLVTRAHPIKNDENEGTNEEFESNRKNGLPEKHFSSVLRKLNPDNNSNGNNFHGKASSDQNNKNINEQIDESSEEESSEEEESNEETDERNIDEDTHYAPLYIASTTGHRSHNSQLGRNSGQTGGKGENIRNNNENENKKKAINRYVPDKEEQTIELFRNQNQKSKSSDRKTTSNLEGQNPQTLLCRCPPQQPDNQENHHRFEEPQEPKEEQQVPHYRRGYLHPPSDTQTHEGRNSQNQDQVNENQETEDEGSKYYQPGEVITIPANGDRQLDIALFNSPKPRPHSQTDGATSSPNKVVADIACTFSETSCNWSNDHYQESLFQYGYSPEFGSKLWFIHRGRGQRRGWGRVMSPAYEVMRKNLQDAENSSGNEACLFVEFEFDSEGTDHLVVLVQEHSNSRPLLDYMHERPGQKERLLLRKFVPFVTAATPGGGGDGDRMIRFFVQLRFDSSRMDSQYGLRQFDLAFQRCPHQSGGAAGGGSDHLGGNSAETEQNPAKPSYRAVFKY